MDTQKNDLHEGRAFDLKKIIKALNQKPVAYYPIYRTAMGSVAGGVLLSQIMFWYSVSDSDEFSISDTDLKKQTKLSDWEFKVEKYKLRSIGFIEIKIKGVPPKTSYKIDIQKFIEKLSNLEDGLQNEKNNDLSSIAIGRPSSKLNGRPSSKLNGRPSSKFTFIEILKRDEEGDRAPKNGAPKSSPQISPSSANESQKQIPTRHMSEWDMWKVEQGEPTYEKYFNRRPYFNGKDLNEFCRLRGDGATVAQITKCYEEFCRTENAYYAKRGYAFHIFAEDFNAFGNEKMKSIVARTERNGNRKNSGSAPNVVVEDLAERTLKEFGLA